MSDIYVSYGTAVNIGNTHLAAIKTAVQLIDDAVHAEDFAWQAEDKGMSAMTVRADAAGAMATTNGDYQPLITDVNGRLHVHDVNSAAILAKIIAAPATEAKQDVIETSLDAILAKIITAPATEAKQDTLETTLTNIESRVNVGALVAGVKTFDVGDGEVNFDSQVVTRYVDVVVNDMGDATWIVIGTTGTPTVGIKLTAIGQGVQHLPVSNVNLIKMDTNATAGNDVTIAYIGV